VINITFHGIGGPPENTPDEDREMWLSKELFQLAIDLIKRSDNVCISVDDGNLSDIEILFPELLRCNLKASLFMPANFIGKKGHLGKTDLRQWKAAGLNVGSHGIQHVNWRILDNKELEREVFESKDKLEQIVGHSIREAACPFGYYDRRVLRHLRKAGYKRIYTSDGGHAFSGAWLQPRNSLHAWDNRESIQKLLSKRFFSFDCLVCTFKTMIKRVR
jgi:peptidoglycan/xylan/chitin deacetylase (PgdA/CDA1 family)